MTIDAAQRVPVGDTVVTALGFGAAAIGGLFEPVPDEVARAAIEHAWDGGVRYFDAAPLYGYGLAERRVGEVLRDRPRDQFTVSTKVGRLLVPTEEVDRHPELDRDRQEQGGVADSFYKGVPPVHPVFDYSADGVKRSIEASLERFGLDAIDIVYIHDPDEHWQPAIDEAIPALHALRDQGVVRAIGAGMNQAEMLTRFVREGDVDVVLCAGRYTLLDHGALDELFPACEERGVAVVIGGVMNSGLLVDPKPGATFNYVPVTEPVLARALALRDACAAHGVPLRAAALQFALAHPVVASVLVGGRTADQVDDTLAMARLPVPVALWQDLVAQGLIPDGAPVPAGDAPA
jgi:D-threo-aldose 1-dehydrogenase